MPSEMVGLKLRNNYCFAVIREVSTNMIQSSIDIDRYLTETGTAALLVKSSVVFWRLKAHSISENALLTFPQCSVATSAENCARPVTRKTRTAWWKKAVSIIINQYNLCRG